MREARVDNTFHCPVWGGLETLAFSEDRKTGMWKLDTKDRETHVSGAGLSGPARPTSSAGNRLTWIRNGIV